MRWVRFDSGEAGPRVGLIVGDAVHVLTGSQSLVDLLSAGALDQAGDAARRRPDAVVPLTGLPLLAPVTAPPSIRDFMAFEQHVEGVSRLVAGSPGVPDVWYRQPLFYFSNPASVIGPFDDVAQPPGSAVLDYELEIAAVMGQAGSDLSVDEAESAIAGFMVMNDWSARDLQFEEMQGPLGPCKGKDSAITLGPALVTPDEIADRRSGAGYDLTLSVWVNEQEMGRDRWSAIGWSFAEMVAYASRGTRLQVGDVIGSGTCGNGCLAELWGRQGRDAHPPLQVGDVVRLEIEGLGETRNRVTAGAPVRAPLSDRRALLSDQARLAAGRAPAPSSE